MLQKKLWISISNQLKLNNQICDVSYGLNQVQHFFYIFLFNYMIRKAYTCKIENQLNIETFVWDPNKPINIKPKQITLPN